MIHEILLVVNSLTLFVVLFLFRRQTTILRKIDKFDNGLFHEKNQKKEQDIQTNLGRRLLEIQESRYARPYARFQKEVEDDAEERFQVQQRLRNGPRR
jgi:hypothetical protein